MGNVPPHGISENEAIKQGKQCNSGPCKSAGCKFKGHRKPADWNGHGTYCCLACKLYGAHSHGARCDRVRAHSYTEPKKKEKEKLSFIAYHGTSLENAKNIAKTGFRASDDGCLGRGVYVGPEQKAIKFARDHERHHGKDGALVKALVTIDNPKFLRGGNAKTSDHASHDALRTNWTSRSPNPEWAIRNASNVKALSIQRVPTDVSTNLEWGRVHDLATGDYE